MQQIRACTEGKGGHAAFASILWSPPATFPGRNFYDSLKMVQCDVLMVFGKDDPWCTPAFAKKMIEEFNTRELSVVGSKNGGGANRAPVCRYIQLDGVGHCPNHEAPGAVGSVWSAWVRAEDRGVESLRLLDGQGVKFQEDWADVVARELQSDDIPVNWLDRLATTFV